MKHYTISFDIQAPDSIRPDEVLSSIQGKVYELQIGQSRLFPRNLRIHSDFEPVRSDPSSMRDRNEALNGEVMALVEAIRDEAREAVGARVLSPETTQRVNQLAKRVIKKIDRQ